MVQARNGSLTEGSCNIFTTRGRATIHAWISPMRCRDQPANISRPHTVRRLRQKLFQELALQEDHLSCGKGRGHLESSLTREAHDPRRPSPPKWAVLVLVVPVLSLCSQ